MNLFNHFTADGHLGWVQVWTIINNAAKNILINVYWGTCAPVCQDTDIGKGLLGNSIHMIMFNTR